MNAVEIEESIRQFARAFDLSFPTAMKRLASNHSLEIAGQFLGWGESIRQKDLEALGSFLDHRGYTPPKLRGEKQNRGLPARSEYKEDTKMALTKEHYIELLEQGHSREEIAAMSGLKVSSLSVMVSKWGLSSKPKRYQEATPVVSPAAALVQALDQAVQASKEAAERASEAAWKEAEKTAVLPEKAKADEESKILDTLAEQALQEYEAGETQDLREIAAEFGISGDSGTQPEDARKYVTIRLPIAATTSVGSSINRVSIDIIENAKVMGDLLSRVMLDLQVLLGQDDVADYVQRYVDRHVSSL